MKFGFIPTEGGCFYQDFLDEVRLGEELGFDSAWLEEHHGVRDHYWPSPLIGLAGAATRTEKILLGTDILILPLYHPVRVAEDAALIDIISGGRFILGVAIGYKPDEFALHNVEMEKRGERFAEAVELIQRLWTQEQVHFEGKYYRVDGLKIEPRPSSQPRPPIWIGGWGQLSLGRAARLGDAWIPGPTANLDKLLQAQQDYHDELRTVGSDIDARPRPLTREVVIAATDADAYVVAEKHLLINYRDEYGGGDWKHPLIGGSDYTPVDDFQTLSKRRFVIGSPETVIRQIQEFQVEFGVDHLICRLYFPGISHNFICEELKLLAREVIPVFQNQGAMV